LGGHKIEDLYAKIPYSFKIALLITLTAKLMIFVFGYAVAYNTAAGNGASLDPIQLLMNQFAKWDSPHYTYLAQFGYTNVGDPANFIVFFPLYPFLVRLITINFAYVNLSGLIISNVSSTIAVIYLAKLVKLDYSDSVAKKTVLFLSVFPTAYFLSAVFTEGLFLGLVVASLYYARSGKMALAGFIGMLASLTRIAGLILLPALAVEYFHQKGWKIKALDLRFLWIILPALGFLVYLIINFQVTGNFFAFLEIERVHWFQTINPLNGLAGAVYFPSHSSFPDSITIGYSQVIFALFGLIMIVVGYKLKLRASYQVYMFCSWGLAVSTGFWISVPRYVLMMFPMFIALALISKKKAVTTAIVTVSLTGLFFFTWLFASGAWAF
jgi:Gpi18-like mannosyltransferase